MKKNLTAYALPTAYAVVFRQVVLFEISVLLHGRIVCCGKKLSFSCGDDNVYNAASCILSASDISNIRNANVARLLCQVAIHRFTSQRLEFFSFVSTDIDPRAAFLNYFFRDAFTCLSREETYRMSCMYVYDFYL